MNKEKDIEKNVEEDRNKAIWDSAPVTTFAELDEVLHKWQEITDWGLTKAICAFVIANRLPGNSVWALLVGSSGSGKTEMISGLNYIPFIFSLSSLTPQTLISGQRGVQGLLWELSDKLLTIKDLTTILEMNSDARSEIFAQFREMYDGSFEKSYGTGETKKWAGKVGLFAGVTSVIDIREQAYSALGERFIKYRIIPPNRRTIARRALENTTKTVKMQEEIKEYFARFIKTVIDLVKPEEDLALTDSQKDQLIRLADFTTLARSPVTRDFGMTKDVIYKPSSEMPTRFTQQLSQVAIALKLINRASGLSDELLDVDNKILFKIALDSIPQMRRQMLQKLAENISITTEQAAEATSYPTSTARRYLEDLFVLGICDRKRGENQSHVWILKEEFREVMAEYDGVKMMSEEEHLMQEAEALAVRDIFEDENTVHAEDNDLGV